MACPVCHRAKCRWAPLAKTTRQVTDENLVAVINHNARWASENKNSRLSRLPELDPYIAELIKRFSVNFPPLYRKSHTETGTENA